MKNNKNISNKIKESFEGQSFQAPKDMWSTISTDLNYRKLDDKIKSSFVTAQFAAPDFNWSELGSNKLDKKVKESYKAAKYTAPLFDFSTLDNSSPALDSKIAESFEQTKVAAPDSTWNGIEDKLDVNKVWDKLSDNIVVNNRSWTKWVAAASIAILVSVLPSTIKNQDFTAEIEFSSPFLVSDNSVSSENELISLNNSLPSPGVGDNDFNDSPMLFEELGVLAQSPTHNQLNEVISTVRNTSNNKIDRLEITGISQLENQIVNVMHNADELNKWEETSQHPINKVKRKSSKSGFRIGVIGGLSSSWILDNDTRESFDKTSLNDSKLAIGQMYGVSADYYFNDYNGISTNVLFNSRSKNRVGYYENGVYKIRKTEINYFKTALLYNRRINFYGKKNKHSFTVSGGPYVSLNRNSNISENETITSLNSQFKKLNYGVTVLVGEEIEWSKFVLGYGINSELGLRNIFKGETVIQSDLNFTNNLDLGLFVSLKYKL